MELKEAIGLRRSVRYLDPERPVERTKIQKMLEAARRASHWGNVQSLRAVVVERATAPKEVIDSLEAYVGNFQMKIAPVVIVWYLDAQSVDEQPDRLREIVEARAMGIDLQETRDRLERVIIPFFEHLTDVLKSPGMSEVDCGQGIAQATLVAFEEGLGTCLLGSAKTAELISYLGLPDQARILVLQTVGYPAEDVYKAGQRPRLPLRADLPPEPLQRAVPTRRRHGQGARRRGSDPVRGARRHGAPRQGAGRPAGEVRLPAALAAAGCPRRC
ncbi:MAG: nitroreductase family protein [Acidimicrobiia bacterium]|nr:nitroreductase family protein [Acidimicrobiia bacterium]